MDGFFPSQVLLEGGCEAASANTCPRPPPVLPLSFFFYGFSVNTVFFFFGWMWWRLPAGPPGGPGAGRAAGSGGPQSPPRCRLLHEPVLL